MIKKAVLFSTVLVFGFAAAAFADGNAFTPLNFDDASYEGTNQPVAKPNPSYATASGNANQVKEITGNEKMQSAILSLDNAQVEVRNELLEYKAKYSEVDNKYVTIKAERKALGKQIRSIERKIKKIDKTKEAIRKNMM